MAAQRDPLFERRRVPQLCGLVTAAGSQSSVGGECQGRNAPLMSLEEGARFVLFQVPQTNGPVGATSRQRLAAGRECQAEHLVLMPLEGRLLFAATRIPELHSLVRACGGDGS